MLEIEQHDGPARRGKWLEMETPRIINSRDLQIVVNQPLPYNVPRNLAEWGVDKTLKFAENGDRKDFVVIQGSQYSDLRVKCLENMEMMGYRNFILANTDHLIKNPRDLVEIIVKIKKSMNPNSTLLIPFYEPSFIPLLAYMGVDLFEGEIANFFGQLNTLITPDNIYPLDTYAIYELNKSQLVDYNKKNLDFVIREVRENLKNGTLRNLVESRCASKPETMAALRLLDQGHQDYLDNYTPLY